MSATLLITVIADDRPGVVRLLSDVIKSHHGNWLESSLSRLGGEFAGLIRVNVPFEHQTSLEQALAELQAQGINVFNRAANMQDDTTRAITQFSIMANDRSGIIEEISTVLAQCHVNVEKLDTRCEPAAMSGDMMFIADIQAYLPDAMSQADLQDAMEKLSDDLVIEYHD